MGLGCRISAFTPASLKASFKVLSLRGLGPKNGYDLAREIAILLLSGIWGILDS